MEMNWDIWFTYKDGKLYWKHEVRSGRGRSHLNCAAGSEAGTLNKVHGYWYVKLHNKLYKRSLIVYEMHNGPLRAGHHIDHINHNRLEDTPDNLRAVLPEKNMQNKSLYRSNRSGYVGVHRKRGRWIATLGNKQLGSFSSIEQAVECRRLAAEAAGYHHNHGVAV